MRNALTLKKTCQKLGLSFWHYLHDRVSQKHAIPPLPSLIQYRRVFSLADRVGEVIEIVEGLELHVGARAQIKVFAEFA